MRTILKNNRNERIVEELNFLNNSNQKKQMTSSIAIMNEEPTLTNW